MNENRGTLCYSQVCFAVNDYRTLTKKDLLTEETVPRFSVLLAKYLCMNENRGTLCYSQVCFAVNDYRTLTKKDLLTEETVPRF